MTFPSVWIGVVLCTSNEISRVHILCFILLDSGEKILTKTAMNYVFPFPRHLPSISILAKCVTIHTGTMTGLGYFCLCQ